MARYEVGPNVGEALGDPSFDHGYHHERSFIPLSPVARFLLGLCFREHCLRAISAEGGDTERARRFVRTVLEHVLNSEPAGLSPGEVTREALVDGELGRFLAARKAVITTLVEEVTAAVEATGAPRFTVMEMSGVAKGYTSGQPTGGPAPAGAWQDAIDPAAVAAARHGRKAIGFAREPMRLRFDLKAYRQLLPAGASLLSRAPPDAARLRLDREPLSEGCAGACARSRLARFLSLRLHTVNGPTPDPRGARDLNGAL